jgi:hypothetical protein
MIRYPSFSFVFFIIFIAISLYQIKHFILKREVELAKINKNIMLTKSDIWNIEDLVSTQTIINNGELL